MKKLSLTMASALVTLAALHPNIAFAGKPFKNGPMTVVLDSPISTHLNKAGDSFTAHVIAPAEIEGAILEGHIKKVEPAQKGTAPKSHISFGFETITIGDVTYKIQAELKEVTNAKGVKKVDEEGQVFAQGNGMKKALFAGGGAGMGALAGGMLGGGLGAAVGGLAGGALGYVIALEVTTSGTNIDFFPGSTFVLEVTDKGVNKDVKAEDVRKLDADAIAAQKNAPAVLPVEDSAVDPSAAPVPPPTPTNPTAPVPPSPVADPTAPVPPPAPTNPTAPVPPSPPADPTGPAAPSVPK